ncbi:MAG: hypothetical protein RLZZ383_1954, partial [Pseudomonadota bacterium]
PGAAVPCLGGGVVRIGITGGTGLIGSALRNHLLARGDEVLVLTRGGTSRIPSRDQVLLDPLGGGITAAALRRLDGLDALFHLGAAPLAARPWTPARRHLLRESRVEATEALWRTFQRLDRPPEVIVGVGSLGMFGDRGVGHVDDDDHPAAGFLAELSAAWETAHRIATDVLGARTAVLRMGIVLASEGGALPLLARAFHSGIGGWAGDGRQVTPWISLHDAVRALTFLLDTPEASGGFNGAPPDLVANRAWCEALGAAAGHPIRTHAPKWALRGALGDLAEGLLLASCRATPRKLQALGFRFDDVDVDVVFRRLVAEILRE